MKYILTLILVVSLSSCELGRAKYRIESGKEIHYTDNYNKNSDGCITFQERCNCGSNEFRTVMMCGTYTIIELNKQ